MRNDFLPFSKPSISEEDIAAVADVLRSGWITTGPKVAQFEEDFKKYTSCGEAVSMTSETSVMHALLRALNIGPGDEVITPSMTWVSLPNTVLLFGATPVFVDVDEVFESGVVGDLPYRDKHGFYGQTEFRFVDGIFKNKPRKFAAVT